MCLALANLEGTRETARYTPDVWRGDPIRLFDLICKDTFRIFEMFLSPSHLYDAARQTRNLVLNVIYELVRWY